MKEENKQIEYIVPESYKEVRADKVLSDYFTELSRTQLQKAFTDKTVLCDGKPINKSFKVSAGDKLVLELPDVGPVKVEPVDIPLDILYEDEDIVVVNKKAGMVVHPGNKTGEDTLVHALLYYCQGKLSHLGGERRPGVVHRLDRETSGAIILAKTDKAYLKLIKQFSEREVKKEYLAMVIGVPRLLGGSIKESIGRHPTHRTKMCVDPKGREAHTDWQVEKKISAQSTLLRCFLHTGRTHQIRVHLSHIGHPIMGDEAYANANVLRKAPASRVMLHAKKLELDHPVTGERLKVEAPLPVDFKKQLGS